LNVSKIIPWLTFPKQSGRSNQLSYLAIIFIERL